MIIVVVTHGKGNDCPDYVAVKLFSSKDEAHAYIDKVSDTESKYWTVAEIVDEGQAVEPTREGYISAGSRDWL